MCMWVGMWFASHNISDYMLQDLVYARVCVWVSVCAGCKEYNIFERLYCKVHCTFDI